MPPSYQVRDVSNADSAAGRGVMESQRCRYVVAVGVGIDVAEDGDGGGTRCRGKWEALLMLGQGCACTRRGQRNAMVVLGVFVNMYKCSKKRLAHRNASHLPTPSNPSPARSP